MRSRASLDHKRVKTISISLMAGQCSSCSHRAMTEPFLLALAGNTPRIGLCSNPNDTWMSSSDLTR